MFLSTARTLLFALVWTMPLLCSCGSRQTPANNGAPATGELSRGEQPFSAKEPEVYQTEVVYSSGGTGDKYFVARNGATRRFDTYVGDTVAVTELIKDNIRYVIDHKRKMYYADPPSDKGPSAVNPAALAFFQNAQHHEFDEVSRANGQITYRAKKAPGDPDQDVVIRIDQTTGLMVRQEVKGKDPDQSFTFELKNVKLEAPDELFQIPADSKQVTKDEFKPPAVKKSHE